MQKYFAPRRCISCDWSNLPNVTYVVSPIEIEQKVTIFEENEPKNEYFIVNFPKKQHDGIDFCERAKVKKIYDNEQECQKRCHTLNLAIKKITDKTSDFEK